MVKFLPVLRKLLSLINITLVIKVESVYQWIDRKPFHYEKGVKFFRNKFPKTSNFDKQVVVDCHIRRAIVPEFMADGSVNPRYTKNSYYLNTIKHISEISKKRNLDLLIRIHTDLSSEVQGLWEIPKDISRDTVNYWKTLGIVNDEKLVLSEETFFNELAKYGSIQILSDIDPISAWQNMENADILISSKSSFSYVGGLLRGVKPVFYCDFWHSGLPTWVKINEESIINYDEIEKLTEYACQKKSQQK
jgi:hypothetical protein